MKNSLCIVSAAATLVVLASPRVEAACITPDVSARSAAARIVPPQVLAAAQTKAVIDSSGLSIVGLWSTTFYVGESSDVWDQAFELWHSDGTELAVDNAVPPILGNVCVGVWNQVGRTIRLKHLTWNWNLDGSKAGTFLLEMTVSVERGGDVFSGTYVSDSFDLAGVKIPELHAEGVVRGERITVD